ncbi:MAG: zinc metalloprotease [Rhodobacterales bacterium]|nr:MAG: zinc metalloprotease [Rhodobacterales bacterium]
MGEQVILPGDPPIALDIRPSARARRLSLRVSRLDGRVTLTLPEGASRRHALGFAEDKAEWIRRQLADRPGAERPMPGGVLPFAGVDHQIVTGPGRGVRRVGGTIELPGRDPERSPARLLAFLKAEARGALAEAVDRHATTLGVSPKKLTLRDTRSRWGSCSAKGDLMFSWRLIMAPPEVLDYVAAHEVAHLLEMNHSRAFWATVARTCPGYEAPKRWLRQKGEALHRYRFRD